MFLNIEKNKRLVVALDEVVGEGAEAALGLVLGGERGLELGPGLGDNIASDLSGIFEGLGLNHDIDGLVDEGLIVGVETEDLIEALGLLRGGVFGGVDDHQSSLTLVDVLTLDGDLLSELITSNVEQIVLDLEGNTNGLGEATEGLDLLGIGASNEGRELSGETSEGSSLVGAHLQVLINVGLLLTRVPPDVQTLSNVQINQLLRIQLIRAQNSLLTEPSLAKSLDHVQGHEVHGISGIHGNVGVVDQVNARLSTTHLGIILNIINDQRSIVNQLAQVGASKHSILNLLIGRNIRQGLSNQQDQNRTPALTSYTQPFPKSNISSNKSIHPFI